MTETQYIPLIVFLIVLLVLALLFLVSSLYRVEQQTRAIIERNGRFHSIAAPGLHAKIPLIDRVAARVNLMQQTMEVELDALTADNVSIFLALAVQYRILPEKVYEAHYTMQEPERQIAQHVENVARAEVRNGNLGNVIGQINAIGLAVEQHLSVIMSDKGYEIVATPVTKIRPDEEVRKSLNSITANRNLREAAAEKAEANRITLVKTAEAEAQSKGLQGKGIADQRTAIINGLRDTITQFEENVPGASARDAMQLVMLTQYFDTLHAIAASSGTNTIFMNHAPGSVPEVMQQVMAAFSGTAFQHNGDGPLAASGVRHEKA